LFRIAQKALRANGYNLCYNKYIRQDYDPRGKNILVAVESPEVIKQNGWLDENMNFVAEISFANFYNLKNYHCCRSLYATNDNFVNFEINNNYDRKNKLTSFIFSEKTRLPGHKLRHDIAQKFKDQVDLFGSGTGKFLQRKTDSLESYMFQIVIENGKFPEYVSEKFFDCVKTKTIPIYFGGDHALEKLGFDHNGWISFDTLDELNTILREKVSESFYYEHLTSLEKNRQILLKIREHNYLQLVLNVVTGAGYMHTEESYHRGKVDELSVCFE
jgi:hypothetical protein